MPSKLWVNTREKNSISGGCYEHIFITTDEYNAREWDDVSYGLLFVEQTSYSGRGALKVLGNQDGEEVLELHDLDIDDLEALGFALVNMAQRVRYQRENA